MHERRLCMEQSSSSKTGRFRFQSWMLNVKMLKLNTLSNHWKPLRGPELKQDLMLNFIVKWCSFNQWYS